MGQFCGAVNRPGNDTPARPSAVCAPIFGSAASSAGKQKGGLDHRSRLFLSTLPFLNQFQEARRCIDHLEKRKMTAPPHLFYKLHCGGCGRAMRRSNTTVRYFYCNTRKFRDSPNCMEGRLMEQDLIDAMVVHPAAGQDRCGYGPADSAGKEKSRYTCIQTCNSILSSVRKADT